MYEKRTLSALSEEFSASEKDIKVSRTISKTVSTILIITGTIVALVVPILGFLSSQSSEPGDTTYIGDIQSSDDDIKNHIEDFDNHVDDYDKLVTRYDIDVAENKQHVNNYGDHVNIYSEHLEGHDTADVLIEVDASDTYLVRVPPQIWYRTELRRGDTFWALPDASFNIVGENVEFEPVDDEEENTELCSTAAMVVDNTKDRDYWDKICKLTKATLDPESGKYNISTNLRFETTGDGINVEHDDNDACLANFEYQGRMATYCTFDLNDMTDDTDATDKTNHICVWLRNSGDPEGRVAAVAIDVKWEPGTCPEIPQEPER